MNITISSLHKENGSSQNDLAKAEAQTQVFWCQTLLSFQTLFSQGK